MREDDNDIKRSAEPPYPNPNWPQNIFTFSDLVKYIVSPRTNALATAWFRITFQPPQERSLAFDSSVYTDDDWMSQYTCIVFGQVREEENLKRKFILHCPLDAPEDLRNLFDDQLRLFREVLAEGGEGHGLSSSTMNILGKDGRSIEVDRGSPGIVHDVDAVRAHTEVVQWEEIAPLVQGDWAVLLCTIHRSGPTKARVLELMAWHTRRLTLVPVDLSVSTTVPQQQEQAQHTSSSTGEDETVPQVRTPKHKVAAKHEASTVLAGPTTRSKKRFKVEEKGQSFGAPDSLGPTTRAATRRRTTGAGEGTARPGRSKAGAGRNSRS
ncbi:hypothetical protein C8R46DRAFT_1035833 [Mycena filopes]|nr:hypothetical protein C8R46DRAFT_1035833 [Mycena filopes]